MRQGGAVNSLFALSTSSSGPYQFLCPERYNHFTSVFVVCKILHPVRCEADEPRFKGGSLLLRPRRCKTWVAGLHGTQSAKATSRASTKHQTLQDWSGVTSSAESTTLRFSQLQALPQHDLRPTKLRPLHLRRQSP